VLTAVTCACVRVLAAASNARVAHEKNSFVDVFKKSEWDLNIQISVFVLSAAEVVKQGIATKAQVEARQKLLEECVLPDNCAPIVLPGPLEGQPAKAVLKLQEGAEANLQRELMDGKSFAICMDGQHR
jgi:hypothetical protein